MNGKKIYYSDDTKRVLENVFPSDFRIVQDKTSKGYKFVNALYGIEIDMLYQYMDQARHMNNLETFDYGTDFDYYEAIVKDNVIGNTVYSDQGTIKITNNAEFYDGSPTRVENIGILNISGVPYGPIGIEYFRTNAEGSGYFLINLDVAGDVAYNTTGYQSLKVYTSDDGTVYRYSPSGVNLSLKTQDYEENGIDEILDAPSSTDLRRQYPLTRLIKAPVSGVDGNAFAYYNVDHYTPDNGYYWDSVANTYKAVGYDSEFYIDENDEVSYYRTAFNNPYGTGVYNTVYIELLHTPISGTLTVYDFNNLSDSGTLVQIEQSGTQLYFHSGIYGTAYTAPYIGYTSGVPYEFIPNNYSGEVYASPYLVTSWDYCRESGGLGSDFVWHEDTTQDITNKIKITNPISRYLVTYNYLTVKKNKYITSSNSTRYVRNDDSNYMFSVLGLDNSEIELDSSLSTEPGSRRAITFDGKEVRPGTKIDRIELHSDVKYNGGDLVKSNYTLSLDNKHAGYTQNIYPNKNDNRSYIIKYNTPLTLINTGSSVYNIIYQTTTGVRMLYGSGDLYYHSGVFIDLATSSNESNRYVRASFKYNRPSSNINIASSSDGSGLFWNVYVNDNRNIVIEDETGTFITYGQLFNTAKPKEIIIERDMLYDSDISEYEYGVYYKEDDNRFIKMGISRVYVSNTIPSGVNTYIFKNSNVDIKSIEIYEEPREYTDV